MDPRIQDPWSLGSQKCVICCGRLAATGQACRGGRAGMQEDSQLAASRVCSLEAAHAKDAQPGGHLPPAPLQQLPPAGRGVPCGRGVP